MWLTYFQIWNVLTSLRIVGNGQGMDVVPSGKMNLPPLTTWKSTAVNLVSIVREFVEAFWNTTHMTARAHFSLWYYSWKWRHFNLIYINHWYECITVWNLKRECLIRVSWNLSVFNKKNARSMQLVVFAPSSEIYICSK